MAGLRTLTAAADLPLLARFYAEVYLPAFAHQREPREVWDAQISRPGAYRLIVTLAGERLEAAATARIDGGITCEWYPRSRCGLLTYLVVAPGARRAGLGRRLLDGAGAARRGGAADLGAEVAAVFGEVADPGASDDLSAAARLARFRRWGARQVEARYVQPSLGPGLARDRHLRLLAFFDAAPPPTLAGATVVSFLREFYRATEGVDPDADPELGPLIAAVPPAVALT
jgi:GNAT superfamily N-acetyltransferase